MASDRPTPRPLAWAKRAVREPHLRRRLFLAALVFVLSFVPMAGTLGYFSSFLLAPILSLLAAAAGVDAVARLREDPAPSGPEARWSAFEADRSSASGAAQGAARRKIETDPANPIYLQTVRGLGYRLTITA